MPEDLYDQVKRVAEEEDRSISQMIRKAVKEYVGSNRI
jgi:metal-responsive CopG/Arc/MetJ family transcriptional regulator